MAALDFPTSPTVGQQYSGTNGVVYQWDGAVWVLAGVTAGQCAKWTDSGIALTPVDATKLVAILGTTGSDQASLRLGSRTIKSRVHALASLDATILSVNSRYDGSVYQQDDNTKPGWRFGVAVSPDNFWIGRAAAGSTSESTMCNVDSAGNLWIAGPTATKASGTTWANPSDSRIKKNIAPYTQGLAAILALQPKTFQFNGLGGSKDNLAGIGLIADDVQPIMPEMVSATKTKLVADDPEPVDLLTLDTTALAMALVNAVQELAARLTVVEAR